MNITYKISLVYLKRNFLLLFFLLQITAFHFANGTSPNYVNPSTKKSTTPNFKFDQVNSNQLFSISSLLMMADTDGDGILDEIDIDDDNDGIPDTYEYCRFNNFNCSAEPSNPSSDFDNDGIPNYLDANSPNTGCPDVNNDGICDQVYPQYDRDGDNVADHLDLDGDNDGIADIYEVGHGAPDSNGDGVIDGPPSDFGQNGLYNGISNDPDDLTADITYFIRDSDNDDIPDHDDLDVDHDGGSDIAEAYDLLLDQDNDGKFDNNGNTPSVGITGIPVFQDPAFTGVPMQAPRDSDGDGIEDYRDLDSDNDGISDVIENNFNNDPDNDGRLGAAWEPADPNGFAVSNLTGTFQTSTSDLNDLDGDGYPSYRDLDSDNDGIHDIKEGTFFQDPDNNGLSGTGIPIVDADGRPTEFHSSFEDKDADGHPNFLDLDADNDGVNDVLEAGFTDDNNDGFIGSSGLFVNSFGQAISDDFGNTLITSSMVWELDIDYIVNFLELDSDNDGINDVAEAGLPDPDNDGHVGVLPFVTNQYGQIINPITNSTYATSMPKDFDGDGIPDMFEYDSDNDGIPDTVDSEISDPDNNGIVGVGTPSTNSWGQPTTDNLGGSFSNTSLPLDTDGDGFSNYNDLDSDGDELSDAIECPNLPCTDFENDGVPEFLDTDCNVFLADPIIITDAVVCENDIITLNLLEVHPSWTNAGSNVTYTWKNGAGVVIGNSINAVSIAANDPLAIPPYSMEVEIPDCTSSISQPTTVTANEIPTAVATNSGFICPGENATLFADTIPGATYQWRVQGNPNIFSTAQNPVVFNVTQNTVYELTVLANGCTSTTPATTSIQIYTPPSAQPTYNYAINALDCTPQSLSLFSNFGQGSAPITNTSWIGPDGFTSNQLDPVINNPSSANNGSYVVTGTDENGCSVTQNFQVNEIVDSPQPPQITPTGNNCDGTTVSLSATTYIGNNVSYIWQTPAGVSTGISGQNTNILSINGFNSIHEGTYTVQVFLDNCSMTSTDFVLAQAPQPSAEPSVQQGVICEGDEIQFFANSLNAISYQWSGPNGFYSNNENPKLFNTDFSDNGCYTVTVTNSNGCTASEQVCISNIQQKPATPNTSNNSPVCVGDDINLCSTTAYAGLNIEYVWRNAEGTIIGNGSCISFSSNNTNAIPPYNLQVTVDGCISDFSATIQVDEIESLPSMEAFVNSTPCIGESFQLFAGTVPGAVYEWRTEPNGPVIYNTQNPIVSGIFETTTFEVTAITTSCLQEPVGTETVVPEPLPNIVEITEIVNVCEGATLILEGMSDNAANVPMTYTWTGPNNFDLTETQLGAGPYIATIPSVTAQEEGVYSLQITSQNGCESSLQNVQISVLPEPDMPEVFVVDSQVCFGEDIQLSANQYPGVDVTYEWRFNDGSGITTLGTSAIPFFEINSVDETNQGAYTVLVTVEGCTSTSSLAENVIVDGLPEAPNAQNPTTATNEECEGGTIQLTATPAISGATYQWYHPNGNPFSNLQNPILQNVTFEDAGEYYVVISLGACPDVTSNLTEVFINKEPEIPIIENNSPICEGSFAEITATNITVDPGSETQFYWYNASSGIIIDSTDAPTLVTDEFTENTNLYLIYEVDGCASPQSVTTMVEINGAPPVNAFAGTDIELCNEFDINLSANPQNGITGEWTSLTGASISDPANPNANATNLLEGANVFVWSISNSVCSNFSRDSIVVTVSLQADDIANAGEDLNLCNETTTNLNAENPNTATGFWTQSSSQTGVIIVDPTSPNTTITGMSEGQNYSFIWTLSSGACLDYDQDVVVVNIENELVVNANDDNFSINSNADLVDIDLVNNDNVGVDNFTFTIIDINLIGTLDADENGIINYTPPSDFTGTESFTYEVCNNTCADNCATATVTIEVLEDEIDNDDCFVTAAITPNGDGKNDFFEIPCLDSFPNNELMIFNRWGDKVFEQTKYQGDWDGERNGLPLPNGTYFYILKFDLDSKNRKQGYFSIIR